MKYLLIANKGRLEPEALTLIGASTKRGNKSKIGQFGSGNKYALAYLLKHNYEVQIFSGSEEIKIDLATKVFREHEFQVLVINGKETSITLDFGYKWTLWQAIRELYSNALDEGLISFGFSEGEWGIIPEYQPKEIEAINENLPEITAILIKSTDELEDLMFNIHDYIATGNEVLFECSEGKIYRKHNSKACIYYRGIRCYETQKESIFDYDFNNVEIGEDRLIKYSWSLPEEMWKILFKCNNHVVLRTLLQEIQATKYQENEIEGSFVSIPDLTNKAEWKECLKNLSIAPRDLGGYVKEEDRAATLLLPGKLYTSLIGALGNGLKSNSFTISKGGILFHTFRFDELQKVTLDKAYSFFVECKYPEPLSHQILTVYFDSPNILASCGEDGEILLSNTVINMGVQEVINAIIEEHLHLTYKAKDYSREFQDASITEFINYMKKINTYLL
jgi:hypothetical protein